MREEMLIIISVIVACTALVMSIGLLWYLIAKRNHHTKEAKPKIEKKEKPPKPEKQKKVKEPEEVYVFADAVQPDSENQPVADNNSDPKQDDEPLSITQRILNCLDGKAKMPMQIATETGINRNSVWACIARLSKQKKIKRIKRGWVKV